MQIVDLKTLMTMPNGTLFMVYNPQYDEVEGSMKVLTGRYKNKEGWEGELNLNPYIEVEGCLTAGSYRITNWSTTDKTNDDYVASALFAVFDINEMGNMRQILDVAINLRASNNNKLPNIPSQSSIDEIGDRYFCHDTIIIGSDMVKHYDIENNEFVAVFGMTNKFGKVWSDGYHSYFFPLDEVEKMINSEYTKEMIKNKELFVIDDEYSEIDFTSFPRDVIVYADERVMGYVKELDIGYIEVSLKPQYITKFFSSKPVSTHIAYPVMSFRQTFMENGNFYKIHDANLFAFRIETHSV